MTVTSIFFAVLLLGFPLVLALKIRAQRRVLGRNPAVPALSGGPPDRHPGR
jgi:hypothetical protein